MRLHAVAAVVLLAASSAVAAGADDVHLANGKVFEGVVAEWRGDLLVMKIPGGQMTLARTSVREVVRSQAGYPEFLTRQRALHGRGDAGALDWLQLARLALSAELRQSAREAALEAATLDPRLEGLAAVLRTLGYEFDERESLWLPREEVMRRRGYLLHDGRWITREEAALVRAEAAEREREREARDRARLERAALQARLAAAEMELRRAATPAPVAAPTVVLVGTPLLWPALVLPAIPVSPELPPPPPGIGPPATPRRGTSGTRSEFDIDIRVRQPGSLFPARWASAGSAGATHP